MLLPKIQNVQNFLFLFLLLYIEVEYIQRNRPVIITWGFSYDDIPSIIWVFFIIKLIVVTVGYNQVQNNLGYVLVQFQTWRPFQMSLSF